MPDLPSERHFGDYGAWPGRAVVGSDGDAIGEVHEIYLDRATGRPEWVLARIHGTGQRFIPLGGASVDGETLRVAHAAGAVRDAPDLGGELRIDIEQEKQLHDHYAGAARRPEAQPEPEPAPATGPEPDATPQPEPAAASEPEPAAVGGGSEPTPDPAAPALEPVAAEPGSAATSEPEPLAADAESEPTPDPAAPTAAEPDPEPTPPAATEPDPEPTPPEPESTAVDPEPASAEPTAAEPDPGPTPPEPEPAPAEPTAAEPEPAAMPEPEPAAPALEGEPAAGSEPAPESAGSAAADAPTTEEPAGSAATDAPTTEEPAVSDEGQKEMGSIDHEEPSFEAPPPVAERESTPDITPPRPGDAPLPEPGKDLVARLTERPVVPIAGAAAVAGLLFWVLRRLRR